jgi:hypothetical protein
VLTYLAKNDIQANRNETEEEVENHAQVALVYEIEDANVAMGKQHHEEMETTDVSLLAGTDHLGCEQIDMLAIGHNVYQVQASQRSALKNTIYRKICSSKWVVIALAFMSRVAPHYNRHNVMSDAYLQTWSDVNMKVCVSLFQFMSVKMTVIV